MQNIVKLDTPILVSDAKKKNSAKPNKLKPVTVQNNNNKLPPVLESKTSSTEDILNAILPPKIWEESGQQWCQFISSTPATRLDVINLTEQLDQLLIQRKAKETGICPVREELYSQTFDELIRQVTINCAERGLLLLRVRDEIKMTTNAYKTLYESSIAYGMRKALLSENGKSDMQQKIKTLEKEKEQMEKQYRDAIAKYEALEKRETERRKTDEKKFEEELTFLKKQNVQYKQELDRLMAVPARK